MPYDPEYDDGHISTDTHTLGGVGEHIEPSSNNGTTMPYVTTGQDEWGDELGEEYSDEEMLTLPVQDDLEPDQALAGLSQLSGKAPSLSPPLQPSQNPTPQASILTAKRVAVVLHSSPKKGEYTAMAGDDEDILITSDLTPQLKKPSGDALPQDSGAAFPSEPTPIPFPPPTIASQQTITPQPKKRGRPVGWRPGSGPYSALSGGVAGPPRPKPPKPPKVPGEAKRRGRPPRAPSLTARQVYLESNPKFPVFPCEWEGCPAQLQNYETLRAHVLIVHGRSGTCKWADCAAKHPEPLQLPGEKFGEHVEKKHLIQVLWQRGEGPKNTSIPSPWISAPATNESTWLYNANGEQVTPQIGLQVETDEERKKRRAQLDRLMNQRDSNAAPEPIHTLEENEGIAQAEIKRKQKKRMFRDYQAQVMGANDQPPRYGPEWKGLLVKVPIHHD